MSYESDNKTAAILGFAAKGRKLILGIDNIEKFSGRIYSVYYDGGLSEKSQKNIAYIAEKKKAVLIKCETPIESMTGRKNCKAAALTDKNMHDGIMKNRG
jgi:hypothetical protein